jgi:CrcB protein
MLCIPISSAVFFQWLDFMSAMQQENTMTLTKLACLGLAGALGTLARFGLSELVKRHVVSYLPWGTWAVNVTGCFCFGLIWVLAEERSLISPDFRLVALVGFMGAFTTFSTYVFESVDLVRCGSIAHALVNVAGQNLAGFAAVLAGMAIARLWG